MEKRKRKRKDVQFYKWSVLWWRTRWCDGGETERKKENGMEDEQKDMTKQRKHW